ncbi:MAG TPA: methyltransferase domain-containing protein [Thermoanaerobaculia bacterium]|nr:methyltransferase domain-containing protein [Thermoanaerobaculia bacterium]
MRRSHFDALRPVCPLCRSPLLLASVLRESGNDVEEGILHCGGCSREYPIVDGIPILVGPIRAWLSANPLQVLQRNDLSSEVESLLGDVLGPGSPYDTQRQHVGIYAADHYGDGGAVRFLDLLTHNDSPVLDTGCATGGTTFALARRTGAMTIGVDLNFAMLRVAQGVLKEGRVRYMRRRVGVVHDRVELDVDIPTPELVDFWCCDVAALPFDDATFGLATSVNVADCTASPRQTMTELGRVLRPGARALITTPYDWAPTATPFENWLGGHSQRGPHHGAAEPLLRALLAESFEIETEDEHVPWRVRLHDRSSVDYDVHAIVARRKP